MEYDQQPGLIASDVAKTLESFQNLEGLLSKAVGSNDVPEGANLNDFLLQMGNDLTRFKMWVGNQAAHQSGPSSLDYRLREAAHLKQQVIYLLKDIFESLQSAKSLAQDGAPFLEQSQEDGTDKIVQDDDSYFSPDPGEDDKSDCSDSDSNTLPRLSLSTILIDIAEAVDCLLRLSVAIANPAPHDRSRKLGTKPAESLSFYEPYELKDIAHVRNEFPSIANELAVALGMFITRRRQFFECRQAHHERFTSDEETDTYYTGLIQEDTLSENEMSQTMSAHHWFVPNTGQAKAARVWRSPPI
ncbi:hypothetical protein NW766_001650 [Fusarium irregulare]|uniref:Uncharacterized protein n=1 Tax=Fusarium irregulare TaxID=2494466 RepID=A0A9W8UFD2_9HYPO|nr:hypothetical protein NW766_001650 [Fusarium irregulare]